MINAFEHLRSLGFGGIMGSGITGLLYVKYPELLPEDIQLEILLLIGSCLGVVFHRLIATVFNSLFRPIVRFTNYYFKMAQIILLRGILGDTEVGKMIRDLSNKYFLGEDL